MKSLDVANILVANYGDEIKITNLSLNKLVYLAQVEALKADSSKPLFDDVIEAWAYGPVEPAVYHVFKDYRRATIPSYVVDLRGIAASSDEMGIIDATAGKYGFLTAFDLVDLTHREGGAWCNKYIEGRHNVEITVADILASDDVKVEFNLERTFAAGLRSVEEKWPNALRMLEDA